MSGVGVRQPLVPGIQVGVGDPPAGGGVGVMQSLAPGVQVGVTAVAETMYVPVELFCVGSAVKIPAPTICMF